MLLDELDFAGLYQQQMQLAGRTTKKPEHWDKRAEAMANDCAPANDGYLTQLLAKIDLRGASTLFDMGCGPGSVCLNIAENLTHVYGVDYSQGMLDVAHRRANAMGLNNVTLLHKSWEDDWQDIPQCDIAVASRSTLVSDLRAALIKLNDKAKLRVYTTHTVSTSFVDVEIQAAIGRNVIELPNYIFAVNILYQMGINPQVDYIKSNNCLDKNNNFEQFSKTIDWSLGGLTDEENNRLFDYYQHKSRIGEALISPSRDWALVYWDKVALSK